MRSFQNNKEWHDKSQQIIPACCSTLAKTPSRLFSDYNPFCASSAAGSYFMDIDGNRWIDCEMSMGTVVWGHNPTFLKSALIKQIEKGITFSTAGENELEYAEILLKKFSEYDSIKFFKNGADAVYAAIRLCRYISGKTGVLSCEYHGWLDWCSYHYYGKEPKHLGISQNIEAESFWCEPEFNSITSTLHVHKKLLACVVLCPSRYPQSELSEIFRICRQYGIFVIFDEVTSGVRYGYKGTSGAYELYPDFLCLSKGLTNGLPLAVCLGKNKSVLTMETLRISNAHSSENLSIAAAIACEKEMATSTIWPSWQEEGLKILCEIENCISQLNLQERLHLTGYPGNFHLSSQQDFYTDPFREILVKKLSTEGIFSKGFILFSAAHSTIEIEMVKQIIIDCINIFAELF